MAFGTYCKSLYDACIKVGHLPVERRVALDLRYVRESRAQVGGVMRLVFTEHRRVDSITTCTPS